MRLSIISILFFLASTIKAQDTLHVYEFGSTLVTINSLNTKYTYAQERPSFEIVNALFFRFHKKRNAYRAHASYVENRIDYNAPKAFADGVSGWVNNKNFMIGVGVQRNLKKTKNWLYVFADLCYRNTFSNGVSTGGFWGLNNKYSTSSNGIDTYLGLGFKIKIIKQIILSPELTYNIYYSHSITKSQEGLGISSVSKLASNNFNINSIFKLHLTAKF